MEVRLVDKPTSESNFVTLDCIRKCYLSRAKIPGLHGYKHHRKNQPSWKSSKKSDAALRAKESSGVVSSERVDRGIPPLNDRLHAL